MPDPADVVLTPEEATQQFIELLFDNLPSWAKTRNKQYDFSFDYDCVVEFIINADPANVAPLKMIFGAFAIDRSSWDARKSAYHWSIVHSVSEGDTYRAFIEKRLRKVVRTMNSEKWTLSANEGAQLRAYREKAEKSFKDVTSPLPTANSPEAQSFLKFVDEITFDEFSELDVVSETA